MALLKNLCASDRKNNPIEKYFCINCDIETLNEVCQTYYSNNFTIPYVKDSTDMINNIQEIMDPIGIDLIKNFYDS